jgi:hypothetical protein
MATYVKYSSSAREEKYMQDFAGKISRKDTTSIK